MLNRKETSLTRSEELIAAVLQSGFPHLDGLIRLFVGGNYMGAMFDPC